MTKLYRDSEGRTREEKFTHVPAGAPQDLKWLAIIIHDPVAGVGYMFNLRGRVAIRATCSPATPRPDPPPPAWAEGLSKTTFETEDLGKQMMDGILAEGKRRTTTYPAGSAGNGQPFLSVVERWISPELGGFHVIVAPVPSSPLSVPVSA